MASTNVSAVCVNTMQWLADPSTSIAVPVYQRQYRWSVDGCERLLADIRAIAATNADSTHFIGSILFTTTSVDGVTERMLIDGQQRVVTLMLLVAAVRDAVGSSDAALVSQLDDIVHHPKLPEQPRLRLRYESASELSGILFDRPLAEADPEASHLRENYDFFVASVEADALAVWRGLQKLEHVAISLEGHSNPQQVFESLNSTGAPLKDHELIHNYVLMGLSHEEQLTIETDYWIPLEANVGDALDSFLRDYLIMRTGRDSEFAGERGVYGVFKKEFPAPTFASLLDHAKEWLAYSQIYRLLLHPSDATNEVEPRTAEVRRQLDLINTFGSAMYPLLLGVLRDCQQETITSEQLVEILEQLQSLYLRRMVVGLTRDHLAAQLCRKRGQYGYPIRAIAQRTPPDEDVRTALRHRALPHAGYVLRRLQEPGDLLDLQIEHIFPQFAGDSWTGDGQRALGQLSEAERAQYREVLQTMGNLTLLEGGLNAAASNKSFSDKKQYFRQSAIDSTRWLANTSAWDLTTIAERTATMTEQFLMIWVRPVVGIDEEAEQLVPILDAPAKPGYYPGWKSELEYAVFCGERWDVQDLKSLYVKVFTRLWVTHRQHVLDYSAAHDGPVFNREQWPGRWQPLDGSHYLFMGFYPQYSLAAVKGLVDDLDIADEVFVKYASFED